LKSVLIEHSGCTKWAVEGLSECLRAEMKRWGVHVAVIEPGNFIAGENAIHARFIALM